MTKEIKEYKPVGMIKQAPACRKDYKKKNPAGGRYIPVSYLGAGIRNSVDSKWERGISGPGEVSVKLTPNGSQLTLTPNKTN
jgi:hypothetical protein